MSKFSWLFHSSDQQAPLQNDGNTWYPDNLFLIQYTYYFHQVCPSHIAQIIKKPTNFLELVSGAIFCITKRCVHFDYGLINLDSSQVFILVQKLQNEYTTIRHITWKSQKQFYPKDLSTKAGASFYQSGCLNLYNIQCQLLL